ncbi:hypothetical protein LCGC14_1060870 [marine sediment metagenome]|uniref:Uncharacterized protein n=1 Tax=marine sediment metagenome TaxID=412755 RepID=A0A0F9Q425_9ZZZZ
MKKALLIMLLCVSSCFAGTTDYIVGDLVTGNTNYAFFFHAADPTVSIPILKIQKIDQ